MTGESIARQMAGAAMEVLTAIKRAGAGLIITYFVKDAAGWLASGASGKER